MAQYSIKELEHLSGVKAHTIRIWEQRYNLLHPKRTGTNIRFYDDSDLKLLLNVANLNQHGFKISKIAGMQHEEIVEAVLKLNQEPEDFSGQINQLKVAMIELDEKYFDKIFSTAVLQFGFERTILEIVYPFLEKIGVLWQTENIHPAHEHFISNLIRQKMIVAIDGQVLKTVPGQSRFLMFLPEGELHELALLFMVYMVRSRNHKVLYLGQTLPFSDLVAINEMFQPDNFCTVFTTYPDRDNVQEYINKLADTFPKVTITVCGKQSQQEFIQFPDNFKQMKNVQDFMEFVARL